LIREVSLIIIDPVEAGAFERTYSEVAPILRRQPGYQNDVLMRVVENPAEYLLLIDWDSVESHTNFISSADFPLLAGPWGKFQKQAIVRHGKPVSVIASNDFDKGATTTT